METRTPHWTKVLIPLAGTLVLVILILLTYRGFGGSLPLGPQGYRIELAFPTAENLVEGADVKIAGVTVGDVVELRREGRHALTTLEIDAEHTPLHEGIVAIARTKTLLGEGYVELSPGDPDGPPIPEGTRLPMSTTKAAVPLDDFLSTFGPGTRRRMQNLFAGMATAFGKSAEDLSETVGRTAPVTGDLATILETLDAQSGDLERLFANAGEMFAAVGERPGVLQATIRSGSALLTATSRHRAALTRTIQAFPPFLAELRSTSQAVTAASDDLDGAVSALTPLAPKVAPALAEIRSGAPIFERLFDRLPATSRAAERGLPALTQILRALPAAYDHLYPASRELIPLMDLFAAYRPEIIGTFANGGSITNPKMVGAGGKIVSRGGGAVTAWNESIGGWVKKLPTSRSNPYPKPRATDEAARIGHLKAYDCRHTGNVLWLPPTGTGAPPCVTQGPWTFRGKTAYYPRLMRAAP